MRNVHRYLLGGILVVFGLIAVWSSFHIPPGEGVDEAHHLDYAIYIAKMHQLPVYNPASATNVVMIHHPPLYYLLGAMLISPFDTADRGQVLQFNPHFVWDESGAYGWRVMLPQRPGVSPWGTLAALYTLRGLNIVLGGVALVFIYLSALRLFPGQPWLPLGVTSIIVLNPSFIYMSATVHHDVLLVALYAGSTFWCLHHLQNPPTKKSLIVIGALLGGASITKLSGLALIPLVLCALVIYSWCTRNWQLLPGRAILVLAVAFWLGGWWFVRNQILYHDWSAQWLFQANFPHMLRPTAMTWGIFREEVIGQLEKTFWGAFGFMHILFPPGIRSLVWTLCTLLLPGWCLGLWQIARGRRPSQVVVLSWAIVCGVLLLLVIFLVRFSFFAQSAGQGRYLLPGALAVGALLAGGLNSYVRRRFQPALNLFLVAVMIFYATFMPAKFVWPKYKPPAPVAQVDLAQAKPLAIMFDGGISLLAVKLSHTVVVPHQGIEITSYWQAAAGSSQFADAYVHLILETDRGVVLGETQFWPEAESLPAVWGDRIIANTQSFYIPSDQVAGQINVQVQAMDGQGGMPLAVLESGVGSGPITVATLAALGAVSRVSESDLPTPQRAEVFAGVLRLAALQLPDRISSGAVLPVVFYWQVLHSITADYTVFIHILDKDGQIIAQLDRPPGGGTSPTSTWQGGLYLQDTYPVPLPGGVAAGEYQVRIGLYTWPDLTRAPISLDGVNIGDALLAGRFSVVP